MKIEYIPDCPTDCPLIRIYGNGQEDLLRLQQSFLQLATSVAKEMEIHNLPGFESIGGCRLTAKPEPDDIGITTEDEIHFFIKLRPVRWRELAEMTASLIKVGEGIFYHWLDETSPISLLLTTSPEGQW